jgi:hypothetical protein
MTREQIEDQLRADLADGILVQVGGQKKTLAPGSPAYEARIEEMADAIFAQQQAGEVASREDAQRQQAKVAYSALKAGTATAAQTQRVVAWLLRQQMTELQSEFPA